MAQFYGLTPIFLLLFFSFLFISNTYALVTPTKLFDSSSVNQFLDPQNAARSAFNMSPLQWDAKLANYAQVYANIRRFDCELKHSNGPYGENIFWGSGTEWTPEQAVDSWLSEKKWYNRYSNSCGRGQQCGHYTQIIWRKTERVGCAKVVCFGGRGVFMICNYDPPGNYVGQKPY